MKAVPKTISAKIAQVSVPLLAFCYRGGGAPQNDFFLLEKALPPKIKKNDRKNNRNNNLLF